MKQKQKKTSIPFFGKISFAAAACIIIAAGAYLWNLYQESKTPDLLRAKLLDYSDDVKVIRQGSEIDKTRGMELYNDDTFITGPKGNGKVQYDLEKTLISIGAETEVKFSEQNKAKKIKLDTGIIECDVAPQSAGREMRVRTSDAEMTVIGTIFKVSLPGGQTKLEVIEGTVKATRLSDKTSVNVSAGSMLYVLPKGDLVPQCLVVQIDIKHLLNVRVITTFTNGRLVQALNSVPNWPAEKTVILTDSAAKAGRIDNILSFPDNGRVPATADHPEIVLNYHNDDAEGMQVRQSTGAEEYFFAVPEMKYERMMIFFSAVGGRAEKIPLTVMMTYNDGTAAARPLQLYSWGATRLRSSSGTEIKLPENTFVLVEHNVLHSREHDSADRFVSGSRYIFGYDLEPDPEKKLSLITVRKKSKGAADQPGHEEQETKFTVCLFGAAGVAAGNR